MDCKWPFKACGALRRIAKDAAADTGELPRGFARERRRALAIGRAAQRASTSLHDFFVILSTRVRTATAVLVRRGEETVHSCASCSELSHAGVSLFCCVRRSITLSSLSISASSSSFRHLTSSSGSVGVGFMTPVFSFLCDSTTVSLRLEIHGGGVLLLTTQLGLFAVFTFTKHTIIVRVFKCNRTSGVCAQCRLHCEDQFRVYTTTP